MNKSEAKQVAIIRQAVKINPGYAARSIAALHRASRKASTQRDLMAIAHELGLHEHLMLFNGCLIER